MNSTHSPESEDPAGSTTGGNRTTTGELRQLSTSLAPHVSISSRRDPTSRTSHSFGRNIASWMYVYSVSPQCEYKFNTLLSFFSATGVHQSQGPPSDSNPTDTQLRASDPFPKNGTEEQEEPLPDRGMHSLHSLKLPKILTASDCSKKHNSGQPR